MTVEEGQVGPLFLDGLVNRTGQIRHSGCRTTEFPVDLLENGTYLNGVLRAYLSTPKHNRLRSHHADEVYLTACFTGAIDVKDIAA